MNPTNQIRHARHHVELVMGMAVTIDVRDPDCPPQAIDDVVEWLHHVDRVFSTHKPESPISAMGRGELTLEDASEEIREVIRQCAELSVETGGAFDIFAVHAPNGKRFDPSGFVKGWAIERAAGILESYGCGNFCINAGGDIAIRGDSAGGTPWRIGIRHPEEADKLALAIRATGPLGIATSATYERGAHIIDPREGEPAISLASATVVGPDLGIADAYATAVFVMGLDGLDWIEGREGYEAYLITHDAETTWTSGFGRYRLPAPVESVGQVGQNLL
jgi:thiamine biosynthesis lipoprotein